MRKFLFFVLFWLIIIYFVYNHLLVRTVETDVSGGLDKAVVNYKEEVDKLAKQFNLSSSYLMAVIMLECSGRKVVPPRFEKEIYEKLVKVREKKISRFENVTYETIYDASDEAIKNLATSWGPFQLMGYKCTYLGITIEELRGTEALFWAIKWIDITYGEYIRRKRFRDAFHIHNAGKEFPKIGKPQTHDPKYVENGLRYMKYFEKIDSTKNKEKKIFR